MYSGTTKAGWSQTNSSSRYPIAEDIGSSPGNEPLGANPHLRWHPLRGEWVALVTVRGAHSCPLNTTRCAPTKDPQFPTELPQGRYDVAVFDNRFPSLTLAAHDPPQCIVDTLLLMARAGRSLYSRPVRLTRLAGARSSRLLLQVWADRTRVVGGNPQIQYVLPFENRGVEVGVTAPSSWSDLCISFVPPVPARMWGASRLITE